MFLQCIVVLDSSGMHTSVLGAVWEERGVTLLNLAFRRLGNSVLTLVYISVDRFFFFLMLEDNHSLRKYKSFLTNPQ